MPGLGTEDADASAGNGPGNEKCAGLDAVRQHPVLAAAEPIATLDDNRIGTGARDLCAHRSQERREVDDFGFARGVFDDCAPARERRCHHQVLGAGDTHGVLDDARAREPSCFRMDVAALDRDFGPHRLETRDVQVHRPRANRATARQRNTCLAIARKQRAEHENRRSHGLHEVVGRDGLREPAGVNPHLASIARDDGDAHAAEQPDHGGDVVKFRDVADRHWPVREQSRRKYRQRCVLRPGRTNLAFETPAAGNLKLVQVLLPASSTGRALRPLFGRRRIERQGVNCTANRAAKCAIDELVPLQRSQAGELRGDDERRKMNAVV